MSKLQTILTAFLVSSTLGGAAFAQSAAPITNGDVAGNWALAVTPNEGQGLDITFESRSGGQPDFPLTITAPARGPLTCVVGPRPAECQIENGQLVVNSASRSGEARLIFTLVDRTPEGFRGTARVRMSSLPDGMHIGSVTMVRR